MTETSHYGLYQPGDSDNALIGVLNQNMDAIDLALHQLQQSMDALASVTPQIVTGSYVGTGQYGADHPNSLTFPFSPKLVVINRVYTENVSSMTGSDYIIFVANSPYATSTSTENSSNWGVFLEWSDNSVSWYSTRGAGDQFNNITDHVCHYVAFG